MKAEKPEGVSAEQAFRCGEKAFQPGEITSVPGIALSGGFPDEGGLRLGGLLQALPVGLLSGVFPAEGDRDLDLTMAS